MARWQDEQAPRDRPYDQRDRPGAAQQQQYQQDWRGGQGGPYQHEQQQYFEQGQGATGPFAHPGWMPNPTTAPFHPTYPAYSPFQPSQPMFGPGYGDWNNGGGWSYGGGGDGNYPGVGGNNPWSTGDYRPHPQQQQNGSRNQTWPRQKEPSSSSSSYVPVPRPRSPRPRRSSRSPSPAPYAPQPLGPPLNAPTGPRIQNDQGYTNAASYGPNGEYIPPKRRQKKDKRVGPVVKPTETYLATAELDSKTFSVEEVEMGTAGEGEEGVLEPPLLILDLNHTLLCRAKRTSWGSRQPLVRPYLSTFLEYICSSSLVPTTDLPANTPSSSSVAATAPTRRRPRFRPIVYSSARAPNVLSMLSALSLIPPSRIPSFPSSSSYTYYPFGPAPYTPSRSEGDVLEMVFTREMMGLKKEEYDGDVETTKDLGRVWEELGLGGMREWRLEERKARAEGQIEAVEKEERNPDEIYIAEDSEVEEEGTERAKEGAQDAPPTVGNAGGGGKNKRKNPNKKTKARMEKLRDELGAKRTLLLDDEASKAAQQPHSHLPIRPFIVLAEDFPPPILAPPPPSPPKPSSPSRPSFPNPSRPPSPTRTPTRDRLPPPPLAALQLSSTHPAAEDNHLLGTIYLLERLRCESNVASVIKAGWVGRVREEVKRELGAAKKEQEGEEAEVSERDVDEELARRGREVCRRVGVEVRREWDGEWREKVLAKERRAIQAGTKAETKT
ncbi:hypothetical protein JCM11251_006865 [Rhodosporidiobolus azoricus]